MKVYVIRHGLTELNKKQVLNGQIDEPLAKEGIKQAKEAINLIPETIQYIYSSPMNNKHKDFEALIVTHGGIIRVLHFLETGEELLNDIAHISPHTFDLRKILK